MCSCFISFAIGIQDLNELFEHVVSFLDTIESVSLLVSQSYRFLKIDHERRKNLRRLPEEEGTLGGELLEIFNIPGGMKNGDLADWIAMRANVTIDPSWLVMTPVPKIFIIFKPWSKFSVRKLLTLGGVSHKPEYN